MRLLHKLPFTCGNMHTHMRTAHGTALGGQSSASPARGGMLCRCSASRLVVDTRASYPSGQSGLPLRPAPGVSGSTVLDPAAPQPLGAGVQATRVAAVPVSAPRPVVRPYRPSLWGEKLHAVALVGTGASVLCPAITYAWPRRYVPISTLRRWLGGRPWSALCW